MNPLPLVRALKGAPISVLFLIWLARQPVAAGWLVAMSGYANQAVTTALRVLTEYQLVVKVRGGWMVAEGVQMMLGEGNHDNHDFSATTTTALIEGRISNQVEAVELNPKYHDNHDILLEGGVGEPMASALANMPHVDPEYLHAHLKKIEHDGIGLVIHRIKSGDKVATPKAKQHAQSVLDAVEQFKKRR